MIEHVDDVLEGNWQGEVVKYTAEQNKSYSGDFSMNSHEIKNSLRIFLILGLELLKCLKVFSLFFTQMLKLKKKTKWVFLKAKK